MLRCKRTLTRCLTFAAANILTRFIRMGCFEANYSHCVPGLSCYRGSELLTRFWHALDATSHV